MNLIREASSDLSLILQDENSGFGWKIRAVPPEGNAIEVVGFSNDISQIVDPETGAIFSGRAVTATLPMSSFVEKNSELPYGVSDGSKKPWLFEIKDLQDKTTTFKVVESNKDRTVGLISCVLELYGN